MSVPYDESKPGKKTNATPSRAKGPASSKLFVAFDPKASGSRRDVRRAAAKASADARRATINAKMLAQREARDQRFSSKEVRQTSQQARSDSGGESTQLPIILRDKPVRSTGNASVTEIQSTCGLLWNCSLGYQIDRRYLCSHVFNTKALYMSITLVIVTWKFCPPGRGVQGAMRGGVLWVREETIRSLKAMVISPDSDRSPVCLASAVAVLASWEAWHGDDQTFEVHAQAWRSLMSSAGYDISGMNIRNHFISLADRLFESLQFHCSHLLTSSDSLCRWYPAWKAVGLAVFEHFDVDDNGLFNALNQMAQFETGSADSLLRLRELGIQLLMWEVPATVADQALQRALFHTNGALKAVMNRAYSNPDISLRTGTDWDRQTAEEMTFKSLLMVGLEPFSSMIGTPFEELGFWALWTICAATSAWNLDILRTLGRNLVSLRIYSWKEVRTILQRFVYHEELFGQSATALFAAVMAENPWQSRFEPAEEFQQIESDQP